MQNVRPMTAASRWFCLFLWLPLFAWAQGSVVKTDEVQAELVAHAPEGVAPGKPLTLGLVIRHAPHWHTYWKNPGDSGLPTTLSWQLPAGTAAGPIAWPTPKRLPIGPLVNYGYEGVLLLPVPLKVSDEFRADTLDVKLRADWLVCKESCIPQSGEFSLVLPARSTSVAHAELFAAADAALPRRLESASASAKVDGQALAINVRGLPARLNGKPVQFFAEDAGVIEHAAALEQRWDKDQLALRIPLSAQRSESPSPMQAVLTAPGETSGIALRFDVAGWSPPAAVAPPASSVPIVIALALAFAGGLLLNLMPCVFPVLSLKVLGFAQHAADRKQLAAGGLAYSAGVVLSFVGLAGLLLALRAGGDQLGWGFQLQSPVFIAALALLFTLIALNLLGVFEFGSVLPAGLAALRSRHPLVDHALTGVLAVAVASPCTAPFMGAALGAALTQPAPQALAVFVALGLGMAAPYLAASLAPGLARALPRPGVWMLHFKVVLAFPMFATVVWLLWVLGQQAGVDAVAALLAVLVGVAFFAWVYGSQDLGRKARVALGAAALAIVTGSVLWAWPALHEPQTPAVAASPGWQRWSPEVVAQARAEGRPVFVDFTAAWCVTCQLNKRTTLGDDQLRAEFSQRQVLLLRADWTRRDAAITRELASLGRTGVPVYALYAPGAEQPELLSEILTVNEVRDAMARWPVKTAKLP